MDYEICPFCGKGVGLSGDNIGNKINYYGVCECGAIYDKDVDAKTGKTLRERWTPPKERQE